MPETEALLERFRAANTQVLGVSVDTVFSHANWGASLGGVSFPLVADFHPKGGMCKEYGAWLEEPGIGDRATVIIDREGIVRYSVAVGPPGRRNIEELLAEAEKIGGDTLPAGGSVSGTLYVKDGCGPSRAAKLAVENTHQSGITIKNVSQDAAAMAELQSASGGDQAPCLVSDGAATADSEAIVAKLASTCAPLP